MTASHTNLFNMFFSFETDSRCKEAGVTTFFMRNKFVTEAASRGLSPLVGQDELYARASEAYATALVRLARAYEADPEKRRDLLQEIHLSVWRSLERFEERCSLRTWVYRVAHNTASSYVTRQRRAKAQSLLTLEDLEAEPAVADHAGETDNRLALERLFELIHRLKPLDRQLMLLYLEEMDSPSIAEITGVSPGNVRIQIHRIKTLLARRFHGGTT
jgi:RNA polymerase sigma-70 factor (ECF subfamily)